MASETTVVPVEIPIELLERMRRAINYHRTIQPDEDLPTISELIVMSIEEGLMVLDASMSGFPFVRMTCRVCHSRHQVPKLFTIATAADYVCQWCETTRIDLT